MQVTDLHEYTLGLIFNTNYYLIQQAANMAKKNVCRSRCIFYMQASTQVKQG